MFNRTKFHYTVTVHGSDGQVGEVPFETYWSPEKTESVSVAQAAAAQLSQKAEGKVKFVGVSAQLVS